MVENVTNATGTKQEVQFLGFICFEDFPDSAIEKIGRLPIAHVKIIIRFFRVINLIRKGIFKVWI